MKKILILLLLGTALAHSAYAGFSIGMTGAVIKRAKKLDDKIRVKSAETVEIMEIVECGSAPDQATCQSTGGIWVLVPGSSTFGTSDFHIMKYEAKNVGGVATSQADLTPWVNISLTDAITACSALGSGYHLLTIAETQTINRNIEAQTANWADSITGSLVSAGGGLKRGNVGVTDSSGYDGANPEFGTGRNLKAKHVLSNGGEIWDWSGNVFEWINGVGAGGTLGTPGGVTFDTGGPYAWDNAALNEERPILGPSNSNWNETYGVGSYLDGRSTGASRRGGYYGAGGGEAAGVFAFCATNGLNDAISAGGFRCAK